MATQLDTNTFLSTTMTYPTTEQTVVATKTATVKRCCAADCKRKLMLTDCDCRCGQRYCSQHRLPETHSCGFDFKSLGQTQLTQQLVKVAGHESKLERI